MGISYLPRSRPVRLCILLVFCIGVLHLLDFLPSSTPSFQPPAPYPQTPRREDPEDLQQYLGKVLEQARKDSSSDHSNRKKVNAPSRPQQPFDKDEIALKGNTLVLATHSNNDLLSLISVQKGLEEYGQFVLPGINSGEVKSWVPKESVAQVKGSLAVDGLIKWVDQLREKMELGNKILVDKSLGDTKGGVGGVVLGSCEKDLPLLTPSLLKLHSLLPSTLRFPIVCFLSNPEAFLSSPTHTTPKNDWTSPAILGPWSQLGFLTILVAQPPSFLPLLSNHFARLSLAQPSLSFYGFEHIPFVSFVPALPLPSSFKRAAWRGPKKLGRKQAVKREGSMPLMDVGVVDDGSGEGYEALFKRLEIELDAAPTTFGYLTQQTTPESSSTEPFLPDTSKTRRSQFLLHIILPPPSIVPWTAAGVKNSKQPPRPVVPKRLKEVVDIHWDWEAAKDAAAGGESVEMQFWKTMDELDVLISVGSSAATHTPLSLPLSLSLSIPYLTPSPASPSSSSFGFTLAQPHALSSLETIKLLRTGTGEGVEMGTHLNLRREVLEVLERGWDWHEPGVGVGKMGKGKVGGWKEKNWNSLAGGLER